MMLFLLHETLDTHVSLPCLQQKSIMSNQAEVQTLLHELRKVRQSAEEALER
jgi:hypothetical protein